MVNLMDIHEVRRKNLLKIRDEKCGGNGAELARKLDLGQPYVARMLVPLDKSSSKMISEKTANRITSKLDLPNGWLDAPVDFSLANTRGNYVQVTHAAIELNEAHLQLMALDEPIDLTLPASQYEIYVYQVLSDKFYPRIKAGEYVVVQAVEPTAGDETFYFINALDKDGVTICDIGRVESIQPGTLTINGLISNNSPRTFYTHQPDVVTPYKVIAILNPAFLGR